MASIFLFCNIISKVIFSITFLVKKTKQVVWVLEPRPTLFFFFLLNKMKHNHSCRCLHTQNYESPKDKLGLIFMSYQKKKKSWAYDTLFNPIDILWWTTNSHQYYQYKISFNVILGLFQINFENTSNLPNFSSLCFR